MNSKLLSRISLVLLFVSYCFSLYFYIKLIISITQRHFITLSNTAKVSYVCFFVVAIFMIIMSTVFLILSIKKSKKISGLITILFLLMSVIVTKDTLSPDGYTTTFDKEDRPVTISGEIVNKKIHNFMFNDDSEHYIKIKTKKDLFPVKVIVKKNEYESLSESESFKAKVGVLMRPNGSEPIAE